MSTKMQLADNYVTKYEFMVNGKIPPKTKIAISLNMECKLLKPEEKDNKIFAGLDLQNTLTLNDENEKKELGKIVASMRGIFTFSKFAEEEEIKKSLRIDGATLISQLLRSYINANIALSNSVPNINLPIINFESKEN